ncbi:MAG: hypothetical protein PHU42_02415 [Patescibacteria group bacterium]|nr:hypothetical protein [Patescibacteria group bacterium]
MAKKSAESVHERYFEEPQKCKFCSDPATHIAIEPPLYFTTNPNSVKIPCCAKHQAKAGREAKRLYDKNPKKSRE